MDHKLRQAWVGPLKVVEKLNSVNYRVKEIGCIGRCRVAHVNTLKRYVARDEERWKKSGVVESENGDDCVVVPQASVNKLVVVAEEKDDLYGHDLGLTGVAEVSVLVL